MESKHAALPRPVWRDDPTPESPAGTNAGAHDLYHNLGEVLDLIEYLKCADAGDAPDPKPWFWDGGASDPEWIVHTGGKPILTDEDRIGYLGWRAHETIRKLIHGHHGESVWDRCVRNTTTPAEYAPLFQNARDGLRNMAGILSPAQSCPRLRYRVVPVSRHLKEANDPEQSGLACSDLLKDWERQISRWNHRYQSVLDLADYLGGRMVRPAKAVANPGAINAATKTIPARSEVVLWEGAAHTDHNIRLARTRSAYLEAHGDVVAALAALKVGGNEIARRTFYNHLDALDKANPHWRDSVQLCNEPAQMHGSRIVGTRGKSRGMRG